MGTTASEMKATVPMKWGHFDVARMPAARTLLASRLIAFRIGGILIAHDGLTISGLRSPKKLVGWRVRDELASASVGVGLPKL